MKLVTDSNAKKKKEKLLYGWKEFISTFNSDIIH